MPTSIASLLTDESHNMLARRHATSCTALFVEKCLHMWHSVRCLHCEKGDTFRLAVGDNLLKRYMSRQIIYCMCVYVHIWINLYTYVNLNKTVYIYIYDNCKYTMYLETCSSKLSNSMLDIEPQHRFQKNVQSSNILCWPVCKTLYARVE